MPAQPTPEVGSYRDAQGDQRLAVRAFWLQRDPEVSCPAGHRLHVSTHSLVEFSTKCRYTDARDRSRSCGRCVYVLTDWMAGDGSKFNLIVEVTEDEIRVMRRLAVGQKFVYLGLTPKVPYAAQTR